MICAVKEADKVKNERIGLRIEKKTCIILGRKGWGIRERGELVKEKRTAILRTLAIAGAAAVLLGVGALKMWESWENRLVAAYIKDSVIVGDSVATGYQMYCTKGGGGLPDAFKFLTATSFSAHNALWPVSEKSVHPLYQGEQRPVWESISMLGVNDVFLALGLNDLNMDGDTCACYQELTDHIQEWSPGIRIHVISVTYALKGVEKGKVNNTEIQALNVRLKELADQNGWGFIDLATPLSDGEGNLRAEYCSDGYVHQTKEAYRVWTKVLLQYIREQI